MCWELIRHLELTLVFLPFSPLPPATLAGARDMKAGCPIVEKPEGGGGEAAAGQAGFGAPASLACGKDGKALAGGPGDRTLFVPFFPGGVGSLGRPFPTALGLSCQSLSWRGCQFLLSGWEGVPGECGSGCAHLLWNRRWLLVPWFISHSGCVSTTQLGKGQRLLACRLPLLSDPRICFLACQAIISLTGRTRPNPAQAPAKSSSGTSSWSCCRRRSSGT